MKRIVFAMLTFIFLLTACQSEDASTNSFKTITAAEAKQMMDQEKSLVILDVRTKEEYAEGHIKDALLIPDYELKAKAAEQLPDKNAKILIYCRSGRRSALSAKVLAELGYTNVYDFGGINNWNYDTEK